MSVLMYNNVCLSDIRFDNKPYKKIKTFNINGQDFEKSVYYIDISYKKNPLFIQIPKYRLEKLDTSTGEVTIIVDKVFYNSFMVSLEKYVIESVYKNSEKWFCGKRFTMNKIVKCMVSIAENISENLYRLNLNLGKHTKFYDKYKKDFDISNLHNGGPLTEVVCILAIENLQFVDNMFTINVVVEQAKVYTDLNLVEYSIIDSDSEVESVSSVSCETTEEKSTTHQDNIKEYKNTETTESVLDDEYYKESEMDLENRVTQNFF